jgi:hypothetical protein
VVARKTSRLVDELKAAEWKPSPQTDADGQCEFFYKPDGWGKAVTDMDGPLYKLVLFYNQRAAAETLIKEANNDAGLAAHPSNRWIMDANWFQIAMLVYNLNCWLQLFNREENVSVDAIKHTTLATARLRFLFLAARIWRHAGRVGVSYSDHYQEKGAFQQLMDRLRKVVRGPDGFVPVLSTPLRA